MAAQTFSGTVNATDSTESTSWEDLTSPAFEIETTETCTILVQFFSYGRLSDADETLHLRATVDGTAVHPGAMQFTGTRNTTLTYSGVRFSVRAGNHRITMQWKVTDGTAWIGRRIFTVWVTPE